jgi:peroxiredoxin
MASAPCPVVAELMLAAAGRGRQLVGMNLHSRLAALAMAMLSLSLARAEDIYWGKDFTLKGESVGEPLDLATLKGKPFILYWGCINCGRCEVQVEDFGRMTKSLQKKGVPVIAVQSTDVSEAAVKAHIKEHRLKVPYYPTNHRVALMNSKPELMQLFRGIPRYIVIAADGKVAGFYGDTGEAKRAAEKLLKK